jgi:hypothetical protein
MTKTSLAQGVIVGVDTHKDIDVAVAIDPKGRHLGTTTVPTTEVGCGELHRWALSFGQTACYGVEGTGSYGAGLSRYLRAQGSSVLEIRGPNRKLRHDRGKSDPIDAEAAARAVLAGTSTIAPYMDSMARSRPSEAVLTGDLPGRFLAGGGLLVRGFRDFLGVELPPGSVELFGTRAQVSVEGTVNGHPFIGLAFPGGDARHFLNLNTKLRRRLSISEGGRLEFSVRRRAPAADPPVPPELARALAAEPKPRFGGRTFSLAPAGLRCDSSQGRRVRRCRRGESRMCCAEPSGTSLKRVRSIRRKKISGSCHAGRTSASPAEQPGSRLSVLPHLVSCSAKATSAIAVLVDQAEEMSRSRPTRCGPRRQLSGRRVRLCAR